jgi:hypothetical protein
MEKLHVKQKLILSKFYEQNPQKYSELYKFFSYEDRFPYHIKQLLKKGYLVKRDGVYWMTSEGMKITGTFESIEMGDVEYKFSAVYLRIYYKDQCLLQEKILENKQRHYYMVHQKMLFDESMDDVILRLTKNKIKLKNTTYKHLCTVNYTFKNTIDKILFSNIAIVLDIEITDPKLLEIKKDSDCVWVNKDNMNELNSVDALTKKLMENEDFHSFFELDWQFNYGLDDKDL